MKILILTFIMSISLPAFAESYKCAAQSKDNTTYILRRFEAMSLAKECALEKCFSAGHSSCRIVSVKVKRIAFAKTLYIGIAVAESR